jgi:hypothetical protein
MLEAIVFCLLLLASGAIVASSWVAAKKPNAAELVNKLKPYQGIMGIVLGLWGIWAVIVILRWLPHLRSASMIHFLVFVATTLVALGLGTLMAYPLFQNPQAASAPPTPGSAIAKLSKFQVQLGIAGMILGVVNFVFAVLF